MVLETDWRERALTELRRTFGYDSFLPFQEEIIAAELAGRDVFVLLPTGGGKSLCYQLPALLRPGLTVVVSPLIALMKDQVDALEAAGIAATFINSSLPPHEIARRERGVLEGRYRLVYVAPERLMLPSFLDLLHQVDLAGFAIDEAHCISEWGHDFRPEYRQLRSLRDRFPDVPIGAFTATATDRVQADIIGQLGLENAAAFSGSFNRRNLYYEVRDAQNRYGQIVEYLRGHPNASGIIYCMSRKGTEELAERLRRDGFSAVAYHAGLEPDDRRRRQESFIRDDVQIIVATIAFGMGIDKSNVRFVIHYDLPKTLEGYYQESGRAGRDGEPSDCILFFNPGDIVRARAFLRDKPPAEARVAERQLQDMANWAALPVCRRRTLLAYFGEELSAHEGPCCDVCEAPPEEEDYTVAAQMFLSCMKRTGERFGMTHVIGVLRGAGTERIRTLHHDQLSTYGIGKDRSEDEWRHIVRALMQLGYVATDEHSGLRVTELGREVLFAGRPVRLPKPREKARAADLHLTPHPVLFQRLRALRKELADERGVPPYVIFHDSTLRGMAGALPTSEAELLRVPGVGERKARDFGPPFLGAIRGYVDETGAVAQAAPRPPPRPAAPRPEPGSTAQASIDLFRRGLSPAEIAEARGLSEATITKHLVQALEAGDDLQIDRLVSPDRRAAIEAVMADLGPDYLGPVKERLGDGYTYNELHYVRAWLRRREPSDW